MEAGDRLARFLIENSISAQSTDFDPPEECDCPRCGKPAKRKDEAPDTRELETKPGAIAFKRQAYYCAPCRRFFFPTDLELDLRAESYSPWLVRQMEWAGGNLESFQKGSEAIKRLLDVEITPKGLGTIPPSPFASVRTWPDRSAGAFPRSSAGTLLRWCCRSRPAGGMHYMRRRPR